MGFADQCSDLRWVFAPLEGLFLEMRFVAQKSVYLHHRLRRQLAQYLEEGRWWTGQVLPGR